MTSDLISLRLNNQLLTAQQFDNPSDVVSWFGAMQSQDFAAAKWAIALRSKNQADERIEEAFNSGEILRTHVMRPTWHFVTPKDIRWLLALTGPRVQRFNGHYYRKSGLDKAIFQKSNEIIRKALQGGKQLTRNELNIKLTEGHIPTQDLGLTFTMIQAELVGLICSGPRRGKQFTYMLLDERVPKQPELSTDEALVELTKRYFQSHGPARIKDFAWWSGLTTTDVKKGIELTKLEKIEQNDNAYWFCETKKPAQQTPHEAYLLPGFDEYFIAYADRSDILDPKYKKQLNQGGGMINGAIVVNGKMIGGWKRKFNGKKVKMKFQLFEKITDAQQQSLRKQTERFEKFINMPVEVSNE